MYPVRVELQVTNRIQVMDGAGHHGRGA